jgi:hypothetical protein
MLSDFIRKLENSRNRLIPYIKGLNDDIKHFASGFDVNAPTPLCEEEETLRNITDLTSLRDITEQNLREIEQRIELLKWQEIYTEILEREEGCKKRLLQEISEIECAIKKLLEGVREAALNPEDVNLENFDKTVDSTMHEMTYLKTCKNDLLERLETIDLNITECKQILAEGTKLEIMNKNNCC